MRGQMIMLRGGPCDSRIIEVCDDWATVWVCDWASDAPTRHEYVRSETDEAYFDWRDPNTDRNSVDFFLFDLNKPETRERVMTAKGVELDADM